MTSIFANKELIKKEYIRLFLQYTANFDTLNECINRRYLKKATVEDISDLSSLQQFVGESNIHRFERFFGHPQRIDNRDQQVTVLDRFVLDSINFEVCSNLIERLSQEYDNNKVAIDRAWEKEITASSNLLVEPMFIILTDINKLKDKFFDDLDFQENILNPLFTINKDKILLNPQVFKNWLSEKPTSLIEESNEDESEGLFGFTFLNLFGIAIVIISPYLNSLNLIGSFYNQLI